jgi:hypothetical protein
MRSLSSLLLSILILGCGSQPSPSSTISLNPNAWNFLYSAGVPGHPDPAGSGWYFDFPSCGGTAACSVNYLVTPVDFNVFGGHVSASLQITTTGSPTFNYKLAPDNTCDNPAHVRLFLQQKNDPLTAQAEFYRWWSNPTVYELAAGSSTLNAPLIPDQWVSVLGKIGNSSQRATDGFKTALRNLGNVGFTFGGGCFYGHGVNVSNGTARFTLMGYSIGNQ